VREATVGRYLVAMIFSSRMPSAGLALLLVALVPGTSQAQAAPRARAIAASSLPRLASDLRDQGAPVDDVAHALGALQQAGIPADNAVDVLEAEYQARLTDKHPAMSFEDRVRASLAKGLRGKALAAAVAVAKPDPAKQSREIR
jgi:hypothetical protein